MLVKEN